MTHSDTHILEADRADGPEIAALHLVARRTPSQALTDDELRRWFLDAVGAVPGAWWVARQDGRIRGYMSVRDGDLGHLYVLPGWQGRGIGSALLDKAKQLSPRRLTLFAHRRDARARTFYEARQFSPVSDLDGGRPDDGADVQYVWGGG